MSETQTTNAQKRKQSLVNLALKYNWQDTISYHGDITYSFKTNSITFLEISELLTAGFKIGSISAQKWEGLSSLFVVIEVQKNV